MSHKKPPVHVFRNINDKMPKEVNQVLDGLEATAVSDDETKMQAFGEMKQYLTEVEPKLFPPKASPTGGTEQHRTGFCERQMKPCRLWRGRVSAEQQAPKMTIKIAGMTCKDWSRMNKTRMGHYGPSGRTELVELFEIRHVRYDVVLIECTPDQDIELLKELLEHIYHIETMVWGSENVAVAARRKRRWTLLRLRPEAGGRYKIVLGLLKSYCDFFGVSEKHPEFTPDKFMCAPQAAVDAEMTKQYIRNKTSGSEDTGTAPTHWEDSLPASQYTRLQLYRQRVLANYGILADESANLAPKELSHTTARMVREARQHFMVDLEQAPSWSHPASSPTMPCLTSHNTLFSLGMNRGLLKDELLATLGLISSSVASEDVPCNTNELWHQSTGWDLLEASEKNDLIGNSMNAFVVGSLLAFVIAKTEVIASGSLAEQKQKARTYYTKGFQPQKKQRVEAEATANAADALFSPEVWLDPEEPSLPRPDME